MIGDGSAIKAALLTKMGITKDRFIATVAITALAINTIKAAAYTKYSILTMQEIPLTIVLIGAALSGTFIARNTITKIDSAVFTKMMKVVIVIIGLKLLIF